MTEPRTEAGKRLLASKVLSDRVTPELRQTILDIEAEAALPAPAPDALERPDLSLAAAWARAEAALPEGWRLRLTRSDEDFDTWQASAVSPAFFNSENDNDAECAIGEAVIPSWALLALARECAALRYEGETK